MFCSRLGRRHSDLFNPVHSFPQAGRAAFPIALVLLVVLTHEARTECELDLGSFPLWIMPQASEELARHEKMPCAMCLLPSRARRVAGPRGSCAGLMPTESFPLCMMNSQ